MSKHLHKVKKSSTFVYPIPHAIVAQLVEH